MTHSSDTNCENISPLSVLLPDERSCLLTDICIEREYFFVVDNVNRRVKRYRKDDNCLQDYIFLEDPCGICKLFLSSHIVVTEPCNKQLTYVSVEGNMILSSRRKTNKKYSAIRCLDETRLVVGCCELADASVDILDYTGKVHRTINSKEKEYPLFVTPACLACFNEEYVVISDSGTRNVTCINKNDKVEWIIKLKCSPSGVCVSKSGIVYICLYNENKIVTVDNIHNGNITGSIDDIRLKNPLSISHSTGSLFITEEMPSDRIFQIQIDDPFEGRVVDLSNIHLITTTDHQQISSLISEEEEPQL
ncbi:uncharacterized protein LOC143076144 isoform X1 [Mytilus galloprovincialis]|uniref:uncharacterized protein LOC143076144 isoform X1 n=1 Tax=Mytilus galloprovincialis TaxID=29158 RepID=UPI003F7BB210